MVPGRTRLISGGQVDQVAFNAATNQCMLRISYPSGEHHVVTVTANEDWLTEDDTL